MPAPLASAMPSLFLPGRGPAMWRSLFLAAGTYLLLLGAQLQLVDQVVLRVHERTQETVDMFGNRSTQAGAQRVLNPPDWVPWTLMSTGAITCIYSFTIPRLAAGK